MREEPPKEADETDVPSFKFPLGGFQADDLDLANQLLPLRTWKLKGVTLSTEVVTSAR